MSSLLGEFKEGHSPLISSPAGDETNRDRFSEDMRLGKTLLTQRTCGPQAVR